MGTSLTTKDGTVETAKFIGRARAAACWMTTTSDVTSRARTSPARWYSRRPRRWNITRMPKKARARSVMIDGVRYVVSGDFAQGRTPDGTLVLLGRGSACINSAGEKIFPEEVEEALKLCPAVGDALVFGVPDPKWGQSVAAVVRAEPGYDEGVVRDMLRSKLAGYKQPKLLVATEVTLRAPNGKADYAKARTLAGVA